MSPYIVEVFTVIIARCTHKLSEIEIIADSVSSRQIQSVYMRICRSISDFHQRKSHNQQAMAYV